MRVVKNIGAVVFGALAAFGVTAFFMDDATIYIIGAFFVLIGGGLSFLCARKSPEEKERIVKEKELKAQEAKIRKEARQAERIARAEADRAAAAERAQRASALRAEREKELRDRFVRENAARAEREEAEHARRTAEAERKRREYDEEIAREAERRRRREAEKERREEEPRQQTEARSAHREDGRAAWNDDLRKKKPSFWDRMEEREREERILRDRRKAAAREQGLACCPYCGSTSLTANKKGYGVGKGALGLWGFGLLGLGLGSLGSQKVKVTCLNCGRQFKPGKRTIW